MINYKAFMEIATKYLDKHSEQCRNTIAVLYYIETIVYLSFPSMYYYGTKNKQP